MSVMVAPTTWTHWGFFALGVGYLTSAIILFANYPATTRVALTVQGVSGDTFSTSSSVFSFSLLYYLASVAMVIAAIQLAVGARFRMAFLAMMAAYQNTNAANAGHAQFLRHTELPREGSSATLNADDDETGSLVSMTIPWVEGDVKWTDHTLNTSGATTRWIFYVTIPPLVAHLVGQPSIASFLTTSASLSMFVSVAQFLRYISRATHASAAISAFQHADIVEKSFHNVSATFALGLLISYVWLVYVSFFTVVGGGMGRSTIPAYAIACVVLFGLDAGWVAFCALMDAIFVGNAIYPSSKTDMMATKRVLSHPWVAMFDRGMHFVVVVSTLFLVAEQYGGASGTV